MGKDSRERRTHRRQNDPSRPVGENRDPNHGLQLALASNGLFFYSPNSLLLGVLNSFLRCVRPLCHCWCPPFSAGHVAFLFICLPGLSVLVSALFRWPCSISISQVCHCWCPPFSAGHVAFLFVLASLCICLPALDCCIRLCLAILYFSPSSGLQVACNLSSQALVAECSDLEKHKLFGVHGGVNCFSRSSN